MKFSDNLPHLVEQNWLSIGANDVAVIGHDKLDAAIAALKWHSTKENIRFPFSQGMGLKGIIQGFQLDASAVAYNDDLAPYSLLAVESQHADGKSRLYCLDKGSEVTPVRSDFYKNIA